MSDIWLLARILLLLGAANGAPVFATKLLGTHFRAPLDAGLRLWDGRPVFGESKTIRGLASALGFTGLAAPLLGFDVTTGITAAAGSMLGDLIASFVKRRLGAPPHSQVFGLDQIPEALLPLLILQSWFALTNIDILVLLGSFILGEVMLSKLLFRLKIRDQPY
jgi:CDP-2,3-bis-(O-geranylgeranyl)-sn-glycerol synthase